MTRTLFFLTCLAAMLVAVSAVMIRVELAYPGVSPLFSDASGNPDGAHFNTVATAHALFSYLAVMLLGTTLASAAHAKGAPFAGFFVLLGCLISLATASLLILAQIPMTSPAENGVGWTLYPPLSTTPQTMLDQLLAVMNVDPILYADMTRILLLPATAMLFIGAYAMLSTQPGLRLMNVLGAILTVLMAVLSAPSIMTVDLQIAGVAFVIAALPFVACAAIQLIDDNPAWLLVITLGMFITIIAQIIVAVAASNTFIDGTMATMAALYVFPLGVAWFTLPALILYRGATAPAPWVPWATVASITLGLCVWLIPLFRLGYSGQPMRYVDYPDTFAPENLTATAGVFLFIGVYLAVIIMVRRAAR